MQLVFYIKLHPPLLFSPILTLCLFSLQRREPQDKQPVKHEPRGGRISSSTGELLPETSRGLNRSVKEQRLLGVITNERGGQEEDEGEGVRHHRGSLPQRSSSPQCGGVTFSLLCRRLYKFNDGAKMAASTIFGISTILATAFQYKSAFTVRVPSPYTCSVHPPAGAMRTRKKMYDGTSETNSNTVKCLKSCASDGETLKNSLPSPNFWQLFESNAVTAVYKQPAAYLWTLRAWWGLF